MKFTNTNKNLKFSENNYIHFACVFTLVSSLIIIIYSFSTCNFREYVRLSGTLILLQFVSFFAGSFLGFLFGFPAHENVDFQNKYQRNSSLKEITSWLTKIIVGITLIELKDIYTSSQVLIKKLSFFLVGDNSQVVIIGCIIGLFFVLGFIVLYILSVTTFFHELVKNDKRIHQILSDQAMNLDELNINNALTVEFPEMNDSVKQEILSFVSKNGVNSLEPLLSKRLGKFLFGMKEYAFAAEAFKGAYERNKQDKYSLLNSCFIRSKYLKDFDKSNSELKAFILENPHFAPAHYNLACNYNREFRQFENHAATDYVTNLKKEAESNLMRAFEYDKGLYSEALKDSALEGLDIDKIFNESQNSKGE